MFSADLGGITASSTPASNDPPFQKVALLLHGDGTNGAQNNTFVDDSTNNFTITRTGNVAQGTFSPFSLAEGQWSNYFDGSGDYLTAPNNTAFNFGTGDFTVEGWVFPTSTSGTRPIVEIRTAAANSTGFALLSQSGATTLNVYTNGGFVGASTNSLVTNSWNYVALTRSGNTWTYWINGVSSGSFTNSSTQSDGATTGPKIGGSTTAGEVWVGYMSNIRIVKGIAVYTSNFTPPTSPLTAISGTSLLTCQSNRFKDNSSNNFTITCNGDTKVTAFSPFAPSATYSASTNGGSAYFDGSGDYLTVPDNAGFKFGSGSFTVECWVYQSTAPAEVDLISKWNASNSAGSSQWILYTASGVPTFVGSKDGTTVEITATGPALTVNSWNHIAVVRNGDVYTVYTNGIGGTGVTSSGSLYGSEIENLGISWRRNNGSTQFPLTGYMSNVRIVKGTAVYTANFTPPTSPLTAITNTQLLLNCTNAGIIDNAGKNDIETVGNAQVSTSVKKYGTGSMYFDGTGDYLVMSPSPNFTFGTGDFTVECWVYISAATPTANGIFQQGTSSFPASTTNTVAFGTVTSGSVWQIYAKNTNTASTATWTTGTWYHAAVVRYSGTTKLYINGTAVITVTSDTTNYTGTYFGIGAIYGATPYNHNGYIDDVRITKGQALYTSNFTPPTQAFPNV